MRMRALYQMYQKYQMYQIFGLYQNRLFSQSIHIWGPSLDIFLEAADFNDFNDLIPTQHNKQRVFAVYLRSNPNAPSWLYYDQNDFIMTLILSLALSAQKSPASRFFKGSGNAENPPFAGSSRAHKEKGSAQTELLTKGLQKIISPFRRRFSRKRKRPYCGLYQSY